MIAIALIKILHTNDTHSYLDNFHKRKHFIESKRQETDNVLVVDSGDNLRGSLYYAVFHGKKEPYLLNQLGYDYLTLGNHEFDNGSQDVYAFVSKLHSQVVLSNVDFSQDSYLKQITNCKPYVIHCFKDGIKVGLFGLLTQTTPISSSPSIDTKFFDPITTAQQIVKQLQNEKVDVIILLSHLGDIEDVKLAEKVSGIHYILGSHTHRVIEQPIGIINEQGWETFILQAGAYGQYIGELDIAISNQKVSLQNYNLTDLTVYTHYDTVLYEQIQQWENSVSEMVNQPIAVLNEDLIGNREITKLQSTNLTNLVTDAYYYKAVALGFKPDIAIMNSGGIRRTLEKGEVIKGDVLQILPFACELVICELTGKALFEALGNGEYPQVSHAKICYEKVDEKFVLKTVDIKTEMGYEPLDLNKTYTVVTNTFIASGKDDYRGFEHKENLVKDNVFDTDILIEYLQTLEQPISYSDEVRKEVK